MRKDENQDSVKVRQPLQFAAYAGDKLDDYYEQIMLEELNIKEVRHVENLDEYLVDYDQADGDIRPEEWIEISKKITPELKREGLMREVIRHVQSARKKAGLNIDDRINLHLETDDERLQQAIDEHLEEIKSETLTKSTNPTTENQQQVKVDDAELKVSLEKA